MNRYRVEFHREWITGRWGFTDRLFYDLGGAATEPSRLDNAWLVDYRGSPRQLGRILGRELNIQRADIKRYGAIFEIFQLPGEPGRAQGETPRPVRRLPPA